MTVSDDRASQLVTRTLAAPVSHEIPPVKGSRFIAFATPIDSVASTLTVLDRERRRWRHASHHCFAWRLGQEQREQRVGDDGEPGGTAGRPILRQIESRGLSDVMVVVTRYFGGTKLGTGGLVRAYGGAAASALDRASVLVRPVTCALEIVFPYELTASVDRVLRDHQIVEVASAYGERVVRGLEVPLADIDRLCDALTAVGGGRLELTRSSLRRAAP